MNFYVKRNKKSNLTKNEIAAKLNTDTKKIEELENRELEIGGNTFENYIDVTNMTKAEKDLEYAKLLQWYNETDLRKLRFEFGYASQTELARILKVPQSFMSNVESKQTIKPSFASLLRLYNFYQNDFNRRVNKSTIFKPSAKKINPNSGNKLEFKLIDLNWAKIIDSIDLPQFEIAREIGIDSSTLSRLRNRKYSGAKGKTLELLYNFLRSRNIIDENCDLIEPEQIKEQNEVQVEEPEISNVEQIEAPKVNVDNTSEIIVESPEIEYETNVDNRGVNVQIEEEPKMTMSELLECVNNRDEYNKCRLENEVLREKVKRYEKIIDRLLG